MINSATASHSIRPPRPSLRDSVSLQLCYLFRGIKDAHAYRIALLTLLTSPHALNLLAKCIILNAGILIGSYLGYDAFIRPVVRSTVGVATNMVSGVLYTAIGVSPAFGAGGLLSGASVIADSILTSVFHLLWVYPLYCVSFVVNSYWYQELADEAVLVQSRILGRGPSATVSPASVSTPAKSSHHSMPARPRRLAETISSEIYRATLFLSHMALTTLTSILVPSPLGSILAGCLLAWLYAYYSFEYNWTRRAWSVDQRMRYLERHWAYFLGFGLPGVILGIIASRYEGSGMGGIVKAGVFAIMFPLYVIMADSARPLPRSPDRSVLATHPRAWEYRQPMHQWVPDRVPVLGVAARVNLWLIRGLLWSRKGSRRSASTVNRRTHAPQREDDGVRPARKTVGFESSE